MNDASFAEQMINAERNSPNSHDYCEFHSARFAYVLEKCRFYKPDRTARVLDIGRGHLSYILCKHYDRLTTMGFPLTEDEIHRGPPAPIDHIIFDLNTVRDIERLDIPHKFDLIVFGETIEHLSVAPELVLNFLRHLLVPDGIIICQTPNAVALHKRLKMLAGYNPYQMIRFDPFNPGHIREYTKAEMIEVAKRARLITIEHEFRDYFGSQGSFWRQQAISLFKIVSLFVPTFRRGQTFVFANQTAKPSHSRCSM